MAREVPVWDKWDAFNSIAETASTACPFTFLLTTQTLLTIGSGELYIPTEKESLNALVLDYAYLLLTKMKAEGKIDDTKIREVMMDVAKNLGMEVDDD